MLPPSTNDRLMPLGEVRARCGLSRSSLYRKMRDRSFPTPLQVGVRAVRWRESEVEHWLATRPRATGHRPD